VTFQAARPVTARRGRHALPFQGIRLADEFLVCPTVFFAAKMRKIRNKPDGIHFFMVFVPLCG
jgi:hypothetical protein